MSNLCRLMLTEGAFKPISDDSNLTPFDLYWKHDAHNFLSTIKDCLTKRDNVRLVFAYRDDFWDFLGCKQTNQMFHVRKVEGKSLIEHLQEHGSTMVREMIILNDILVDVDQLFERDKETRMVRVIHQLRESLPSSPWLRDAIRNVKSRFSWSKGKAVAYIFLSFLSNIALGWFKYASDVGTDIKFVVDMNNNKRYANQTKIDQMNETLWNLAKKHCETNFSKSECTNKLGDLMSDLENKDLGHLRFR